MKKLKLYHVNMRRQQLGHFPTLEPLKDQLIEEDFETFCNHLEKLTEEMSSRFEDVLQMDIPAWFCCHSRLILQMWKNPFRKILSIFSAMN